MRLLRRLASACAATLGLMALASPAHAGRLADLSVYDRTDGRYLPVYGFNERHYVIGEPGHEYELHLRGGSNGRVLAVTSVDGVNVLSGETASTSQTGYVINPGDETRIEGWRKSLDQVAAFYFTRLPDSYAARTGRPDNVGVIGVALFRERTWPRPPCCVPMPHEREDDGASSRDERGAAQAAPEASASAPSAPDLESRAKKAEKLGTGHGQRLDSQARYVDFERASDTPDEVLTIWYDSRTNLASLGVIPAPRPRAPRIPQPFPAGFVADP
jgi:hypothetical protein